MEAALVHDGDYPIDPALDPTNDTGLFLPEDSAGDDALAHHAGLDADPDTLDDAAVSAIKASLTQAQAQSAQDHVPAHAGIQHAATGSQAGSGEGDEETKLGSEENPIYDAEPQIRPYSRPERDDDTPHPEQYVFTTRAKFAEWAEGESSWCHFVQRRSTNPAKRAEERVKARIKAHEKMLMEMTHDERKAVPPLKRRKRCRTSVVLEKVTYTCHHAGSYTKRHDPSLPQSRQRLNTKSTVKCNCPSRIVMQEVEAGVCKAAYYWRHEGHEPFDQAEAVVSRVPKVVDDWLITQIEAGKDMDYLRKILNISEDAKAEYVRKALEDPASVDPNMPPPVAFQTDIKYPDLYNRYRKLKGPIRLIKIPKCRQGDTAPPKSKKRKRSGSPSTPGQDGDSSALDMIDPALTGANADQILPEETTNHLADLEALGREALELGVLPASDGGLEHQFDMGADGSHLDLSGHAMLAQLASQHGHADLAQALMRLPSGPADHDDQARLEEEVLKMTSLAAQAEDASQDEWAVLDGM